MTSFKAGILIFVSVVFLFAHEIGADMINRIVYSAQCAMQRLQAHEAPQLLENNREGN